MQRKAHVTNEVAVTVKCEWQIMDFYIMLQLNIQTWLKELLTIISLLLVVLLYNAKTNVSY